MNDNGLERRNIIKRLVVAATAYFNSVNEVSSKEQLLLLVFCEIEAGLVLRKIRNRDSNEN